MTDANEYFTFFIDKIKTVFNCLAPEKTIKVMKKDFNFPVSNITSAMYRDLKFHYQKWKSTGLLYHYDFYKTIKVELKLSHKKDAVTCFGESIKQKGVWDTIKNMFNISFKKNGTCNYDNLNPNDLNEYFVNIPFPPDSQPHNTLTTPNAVYPDNNQSFLVNNVSKLDLINAWKKIKKKTFKLH